MPDPVKRVLLDCDTGVDDSLAILLALRSPELRVEAITVVAGNTCLDHAARNTLLTLDVLSPDAVPPVAKGEAAPLQRPLVTALEVHGGDGLGGATRIVEADGSRRYPEPKRSLDPRHGVDLLLETVGRYPGEVTVIATGPLTNVARAILRDPKRMRGAREILIMGGAFSRRGNVTPFAEFNLFVDPHAAQVVLESGIPVTFVPLNVTEQVRLWRHDLAGGAAGGPLLQFVRDVTQEYMDFHRAHDGFDGCYLHDPVTVGLAIDATLLECAEAFVQVETADGPTVGQTTAEFRPTGGKRANARVCTAIAGHRFLSLFRERVLSA